MANLGTAAYKLVLDASQFANGAALTGRSMREVRKVMAETTTPAEKMAARLDSVKEAFEKGAITQQAYNRWIEKFNRLAEEESAIIAELVVDTAKLEKEKRQLADAAQKQAQAQQQAVQKQSAEHLRQMQHFASGTPVVGRYVGMLGHIHPAAVAATASLAGVAAGVAALTKGAQFYISKVHQQFDSLIQLGDQAAKLGLDPNALTGLRMAGEVTSVEQRTMDMALQRMTRRISEAGQGGGEALGALGELGIDIQRLVAMSPDQQFVKIAEAFGKIDSQADKVRLAFKLFDSEGVALVNTLGLGNEALEGFIGKAEALRLGASQDEIDSIREYQATIKELELQWDGLWRQVALQAAPEMARAMEEFNARLQDPATQKSLDSLITTLASFGQAAPLYFHYATESANAFIQAIDYMSADWGSRLAERILPSGSSSDGTQDEIERTKELDKQLKELQDRLREQGLIEPPKLTPEIDEGAEEIESAIKTIEGLADSYRDQIDTYGMAAREAELYRMAREAVTDEEREAVQVARELSAELDAMASGEQAMNDWLTGQQDTLKTAQAEWDKFTQQVEKDRERTFSAAAKAIEKLKTPEEQYIDTVKELMDWLDIGALSITDFARLKANAAAELAKDMKVGKVVVDDVEAQAFGSAEMFRDIRRQQIAAAQAANRPAGPNTSGLDAAAAQQRASLTTPVVPTQSRAELMASIQASSDPAEIFSLWQEIAEHTRAMAEESPVVRVAAEVI